MAWTAPMTAVTGSVFTAAMFNLHVRDNLLETEAAKASPGAGILTALGFRITGFRSPGVEYLGQYESTNNGAYGDLATYGPYTGVETGAKVILSFGADVRNNNAGLGSRMSFTISGATTQAASDVTSYYAESGTTSDRYQGTWTMIVSGLNGGSNTFTAKYRTTAGGGTSTFGHRLMVAIPF